MDDATLLELFGSLSREIQGMREELRAGFARFEARVARHGGMLNGGARQITRLIEWSEKIDTIIAERDEVIADLRQRVDRLEGKAG